MRSQLARIAGHTAGTARRLGLAALVVIAMSSIGLAQASPALAGPPPLVTNFCIPISNCFPVPIWPVWRPNPCLTCPPQVIVSGGDPMPASVRVQVYQDLGQALQYWGQAAASTNPIQQANLRDLALSRYADAAGVLGTGGLPLLQFNVRDSAGVVVPITQPWAAIAAGDWVSGVNFMGQAIIDPTHAQIYRAQASARFDDGYQKLVAFVQA